MICAKAVHIEIDLKIVSIILGGFMKIGDIVYFDKLIFRDGKIDNKENRPCVVLSTYNKDDREYLICLPITSSVNSFNKAGYKHVLIPESIYNYRKMCFAKLDNLFIQNIELAHKTNISLHSVSMRIIKRRIYEYHDKSSLYELTRLLLMKESMNKLDKNDAHSKKNVKKMSKNY